MMRIKLRCAADPGLDRVRAVVDGETLAAAGTSEAGSTARLREIARRPAMYLGNRGPLPVQGRTAVVVVAASELQDLIG